MEKYFDKLLRTRNQVEVKVTPYTAYSYEDYFMGVWIGNINVYRRGKIVLHATTEKALTEEELKEFLKRFIEVQNDK